MAPTPHRIFRNEADEPKPLAYVRMYRPGRRRANGYALAALAGTALVLIVAIALALRSVGAPG